MLGLGLTTVGAVHTAIGLAALIAGFWLLAASGRISYATGLGRFYAVTTALTAVSGLFIFNHGGFGPPHVLSILTLITLVVALAASRGAFGGLAGQVEMVAFTTTILFHLIPAFTETLVRVPVGQPVLASPEAPEFKVIYGVLLLLYGLCVALQLRRLRGQQAMLKPA